MNHDEHEHERVPLVVATGQQLDMTRPDLGHPDDPQLWDRLHHNCKIGVLVCARCAEASPKRYLYLQERRGQRILCGYTREQVEAAGLGESDEHHALKDKISALAARHGLVAVQESADDARTRRTDVLVRGGDVEVGWEVQLSPIAPDQLRRRIGHAVRDKLAPSWLTTVGTKAFTTTIDRAPACGIQKMHHEDITAAADLAVQQGIKHLDVVKCTAQRGAPWHRGLRCTGWHAQPAPTDPEGGHPTLSQMVELTAAGDLVALEWPRNVMNYKKPWMWVPKADVARMRDVERPYLQSVGLLVEQDEADGVLLPGQAGFHIGPTRDELAEASLNVAGHPIWDDPVWSDPNGLGAVLGGQCPRCGYTRGQHHRQCLAVVALANR
ncbi:competence protein CoiA family protein [Angustibacter aerolatus]